ncbi:MAG: ribonuclease HI family protein [Dehalococcoidales bacterium]|nr:ribonuclease HI family protein [Dehalococcoidales bacterium]
MKTKRLIINVDGAARGNPGPAAIGVIIRDEDGNIITTIARRLEPTTNNQAEYQAIITALDEAIRRGARGVVIRSDSELIVNQINGRYKVRNTALRDLYQEVVRLTGVLESFSLEHVPRAENDEADRLANRALDAG